MERLTPAASPAQEATPPRETCAMCHNDGKPCSWCDDTQLPRRINLDKHTPAERAITEAMRAVEALPADVRLTEAVVLLGQARDRVADFVDGVR